MDNILKYEKLVSKIASMYSNSSNFEDLKQVGMIGLIKALKNYKKSSNTKFSTYAYVWVKGEILEYIRRDKNIKISKEILSLSKQISITSEILRNRFNREPSNSEIALFLERDIKDIEEAIISRELILSCDYTINNDDKKDISLYDIVPYYEKKYDSSIIDLNNEVDRLPEDERKLIYMRYYLDMTQSEVSKSFGTNQVNISRREEKILSKLNKKLVI